MLKRHEVEILLRAGHRKTEVSRLRGLWKRVAHAPEHEQELTPFHHVRVF